MLRLYGIKIAVVLASLYNFNMIGEKNVRFVCLTCSLQLKRILTENKFSLLIVMTLRSHKYLRFFHGRLCCTICAKEAEFDSTLV